MFFLGNEKSAYDIIKLYLLILFITMELIFLLLGIYLIYLLNQLQKRVERLEEQFGLKKKFPINEIMSSELDSVSPSVVHSEVSPQDIETTAIIPPAYQDTNQIEVIKSIPQTIIEPQAPDVFDNIIAWFKKDLLMKMGALFLLMGMGWFVSYAFMNNWIGPMGRISLGLLVGVGIVSLGAWRIRTYEHQGSVFMVLGLGTIMVTVFSARELYDIFTPTSALFLMFLSVLFVAFVSVWYKRNSLALAGLIIAGIAPYLTNSPVPLVIEQFMYLFVVVIGTLWVVYFTGWRNLTLTALVIVFLETLPFIGVGDDSAIVLMWVFLFVATFFVANIMSIIRVQRSALSEAQLFTAFGTAFFLILWVFTVAPEEWQSLIFVAWMFVFSFGTYIVYMTTSERIPFYIYGSTAIALLGSATAAEFSGPVLSIAYTLEVAVLIIVAMSLKLNQNVVTSLSLLFIIPITQSFQNIFSSSWNTGILHADFFVLLILLSVLLVVGLFMYEQSRERIDSKAMRQLGTLFLSVGVTYIFILTALVVIGLFPDSTASSLSLRGAMMTVVYTFEVTALVALARVLRIGTTAVTTLHFLFVIPIIMSFKHMVSSAWNEGVFHSEFFAVAILTSVLLVMGLIMYERSRRVDRNADEHLVSVILMSVGVLYVFILSALVNKGIFTNSTSSTSLQSVVLMVVYALEMTCIIAIARGLRFGNDVVTSLHFLYVVPIIMSFTHFVSPVWSTQVLHPEFFGICILGFVLAIAGVVLRMHSKEDSYETGISAGEILIIVSSLFVLALIWLISHAIFSKDIGTMWSLTLYTITGLLIFFKGKFVENKEITTAGGVLIGFVVARLLLVDVWNMDPVGRIITFIVVGVLLVSTVFIRNTTRSMIKNN